MDAGRPAVRLFLLFLAVALPPLVAFAVLSELAPSWLAQVGTGTALLIVGLFAAGWAAVVGIISSRLFRGDLEAILDLAERGNLRAIGGLPASCGRPGRAQPPDRRARSPRALGAY